MTKRTARVGADVLVVCRANRARSPVVAELLRQYAAAHDLKPQPRIWSRGLYAAPGLPLLPSMQRALASRRLVVPDHSSRRLGPDEAAQARLVVTFELEDKRTVVAQRPALVSRTYTLRELVRLVQSPLWRSDWNGSPDVTARLHALRPLVEPGHDDTPDPAGLSRWRVRRLLDGLVRDVETVAPALLGPERQNDAAWTP